MTWGKVLSGSDVAPRPIEVKGFPYVTSSAITCGPTNTFVKTNAGLTVWGTFMLPGQLGVDGVCNSSKPREAPLLPEAVAVAAGMTFTLWLLRAPGDLPTLQSPEKDEAVARESEPKK